MWHCGGKPPTAATRKSWQKQKTTHEEEDIQRLTEENIKLQLSSLSISLKFSRFISEELRCVEVENKKHTLLAAAQHRGAEEEEEEEFILDFAWSSFFVHRIV